MKRNNNKKIENNDRQIVDDRVFAKKKLITWYKSNIGNFIKTAAKKYNWDSYHSRWHFALAAIWAYSYV